MPASEPSIDRSTGCLRFAYVEARYQCFGDENLWVSVKQAAGGKVDRRLMEEGSSQYAEAWLHSHRNALECDGTWRTDTFTVDTLEWGPENPLQPGQAWVQFCITEGDHGLTSSDQRWITVK